MYYIVKFYHNDTDGWEGSVEPKEDKLNEGLVTDKKVDFEDFKDAYDHSLYKKYSNIEVEEATLLEAVTFVNDAALDEVYVVFDIKEKEIRWYLQDLHEVMQDIYRFMKNSKKAPKCTIEYRLGDETYFPVSYIKYFKEEDSNAEKVKIKYNTDEREFKRGFEDNLLLFVSNIIRLKNE